MHSWVVNSSLTGIKSTISPVLPLRNTQHTDPTIDERLFKTALEVKVKLHWADDATYKQ